MSKRRLNIQQQRRIKQIQDQFQQTNDELVKPALVVSRFARNVEIEDIQGVRHICSIRPNIDSLVAGDTVQWLEEEKGHGIIVSRDQRSAALTRFNKQGQAKVVAANISQMIIMIAPLPEPSLFILDNYLLAANAMRLKAIIVINKTDLPCENLKSKLQQIYKPMGYPVFLMQKQQHSAIEDLMSLLSGETNVIVGQSGVGKSSLVSRLLPDELNIATGELSIISGLGKHTTSNSRYYHLPLGGALIDSPGVREFMPGSMGKSTICDGFPDLLPFIKGCKFRDCDHQNSPHCEVLRALEQGNIHRSRYESFLKRLSEST